MDTSSPAALVNADLLKMYMGRRVRTVVQVLRADSGTLTGQSPDGQQLVVKGSPPFPPSRFVEVIGIADGGQSIRAEICSDFGDNFDNVAFNRLCQLANGEHKNLFL
ncbi:replication protein A 14 kDa subunit-like [Wolffia australiana]